MELVALLFYAFDQSACLAETSTCIMADGIFVAVKSAAVLFGGSESYGEYVFFKNFIWCNFDL